MARFPRGSATASGAAGSRRHAAELSMFQRLQALEPRARLNSFKLDYAATQQTTLDYDCWFVATFSLLRRKGLRLPKGFEVRRLRAKARDWLLARSVQYRHFEDYWSFVSNCQRALASHLVIIAALSVLSEELQM